MNKQETIELLKKDVTEWNSERPEGYINLSNADLRHADLSNANLSGADLRHADLWRANLSGADLSGADLSNADLWRADLRHADLSNADLSNANLWHADLSNANLSGANLRHADLSNANLSGANLRHADLSNANLWHADLSGADLPSPTTVLLANWGEVSDDLTLGLMRYDAEHHEDPETFDKWTKSGNCPYSNVKYQRAAIFREKKDLWEPGRAPRGFDLMVSCIKEKCKDSDYHEKEKNHG